MKTIRLGSRGKDVRVLEEKLTELGYSVAVSEYFGKDTDRAVKDYQKKNKLVVDGIVGPKTWKVLLSEVVEKFDFNHKKLSEKDFQEFAKSNKLEVAMVKAVYEVESRGNGFLPDGRPIILFEGHVFWRQLERKGIDPEKLRTSAMKDVLYPKWTREYYLGKEKEYHRLQKAASANSNPVVHQAAYCSASWGLFQIMGFHYKNLGFPTVDHYVSYMYEHERNHLEAFGRFISDKKTKGKLLIDWLREKNWANFAYGYNGADYAKNKYDTKLQLAYEKHS